MARLTHFNKRFNHFEVVADPAGAYVLIELTQGQWATCDIDDWFSGVGNHKWCAAWDQTTKTYYAKTKVRKPEGGVLCINMNRYVLGIESKSVYADHQNHDTLNNRRSNLRAASTGSSACNRRRFSNNRSRFTGVVFLKDCRKWLAYLDANKLRRRIGRFEDAKSAAQARDKASLEIHGEYAVLNFPDLRSRYLEEILNGHN